MKKKFILAIIFLTISIIFLISKPFNKSQSFINEQVAIFSLQEKKYLEDFFQYIICIGEYGYVLFGDKPMCFNYIDYGLPVKSIEGINYMDYYHIAFRYRFREAWETWKKYQHLFPSKNFVFFEYQDPKNPNFGIIYLINKIQFIKTINNNLNDFKAVIGENITGEEILDDYINQRPFFNLINNHEGLIGTLLGYGRENAWVFMKEINYELDFRSTVSFAEDICQENVEEEEFMNLPGFCALPNSQETLELVTKYKEQRALIKSICKDSFLFPSLETIVSD